ncbi:MAG TPA: hypothetical protein PLD00_07315 [Methanofastidiosum sp.]|jgi:undecaprenyl pyrophosphate phosphatase UppP|nr:hypothetical protein [Methanofastidiosum sp.]HQC25919.1 hypothetical protein [Methanofastidiosum sp.]
MDKDLIKLDLKEEEVEKWSLCEQRDKLSTSKALELLHQDEMEQRNHWFTFLITVPIPLLGIILYVLNEKYYKDSFVPLWTILFLLILVAGLIAYVYYYKIFKKENNLKILRMVMDKVEYNEIWGNEENDDATFRY